MGAQPYSAGIVAAIQGQIATINANIGKTKLSL
jgi:hypothetical protein